MRDIGRFQVIREYDDGFKDKLDLCNAFDEAYKIAKALQITAKRFNMIILDTKACYGDKHIWKLNDSGFETILRKVGGVRC